MPILASPWMTLPWELVVTVYFITTSSGINSIRAANQSESNLNQWKLMRNLPYRILFQKGSHPRLTTALSPECFFFFFSFSPALGHLLPPSPGLESNCHSGTLLVVYDGVRCFLRFVAGYAWNQCNFEDGKSGTLNQCEVAALGSLL